MTIEELLEQSQHELMEAEKRKTRVQQGLPITETDKAEVLAPEEVIIEPLEERAEKRLREKIDILKLIAENKRETAQFGLVLDACTHKIEALDGNQQTIMDELKLLNDQLQPILAKLNRNLDLEFDTLTDLRTYLKNWL